MNIKTYFNDQSLIELFDQAVKANPDFQIAQQRVEIANSFLRRSKMDLLPSLDIGASVSGDHYGKYTWRVLVTTIPTSLLILQMNRRSIVTLHPITGWAQEAAGK